jgi:hypothetical protein
MASNTFDLRWNEPGGYRFAVFREKGILARVVKISAISPIFIFGGFATLHFFRPESNGLASTIGVAAAVWGLFLLLIWMTLFFPAFIFIHETGITRNSREASAHVRQSWEWKTIEACHFGMRKIRDRNYPALWIIAPGGSVSGLIGLDPRMPEETIRLALARYPVEIRGSLAPAKI